MGKFILTESEVLQIKSLYGLNEQVTPQDVDFVSIQGVQPYPNGTNWDLVHGILGSKTLDDDLESRVTKKLKEGRWRVESIQGPSSYIRENNVITSVSVRLVSVDSNPDIAFTTRGSIGDNFEQRHDNQVNGLTDRLNALYKGSTRTFGPDIVRINGTKWTYKQTFFVVSKQPVNQSGKSPFIQNGVYKGIRSIDNKEYTLTIKQVGEPDKSLNGWFMVRVEGPGTYLEGGENSIPGVFELYNVAPNTLNGNTEMGSFKNIKKIK
jgi:hypothetical protein